MDTTFDEMRSVLATGLLEVDGSESVGGRALSGPLGIAGRGAGVPEEERLPVTCDVGCVRKVVGIVCHARSS